MLVGPAPASILGLSVAQQVRARRRAGALSDGEVLAETQGTGGTRERRWPNVGCVSTGISVGGRCETLPNKRVA